MVVEGGIGFLHLLMEESNLKLDSNSKLMNSEVTWIHSHSRQFKTKTTEIVTLHFSLIVTPYYSLLLYWRLMSHASLARK